MSINDIVQTIAEARIDARSLSEFVFKPASFIVTRRLAPSVRTLQYYVDRFETIDSSFTQALNTANAAAVTATNNAAGLIDSVTNNAYEQVNSAIDGVAIDANLVTDALITTSIRHQGQVVRTQADKNSDFISVKDFGAVGDGVTDDYASIVAAIEYASSGEVPYRKSRTVYFPRGVFYCSETLHLHSTVVLVGESTAHRRGENTTLLFPEGKDGIIFHRYNTDEATGIVTGEGKGAADGSKITGIVVQQKNFVPTTHRVLESFAESNTVLAIAQNNTHYNVGQIIRSRSMTDNNISKYSEHTVLSVKTLSPIISYEGSPANLVVGATITGSISGATAKIALISKITNAIGLENMVGKFKSGDLIVGTDVKVLDSKGYNYVLYGLSGDVTNIIPDHLLTKAEEYGTGFRFRCRGTLIDCQANNWPDDGVLVYGNEGNTNANLTIIEGLRTVSNGLNGLRSIGADGNAGRFSQLDASSNGGYGVIDNSFLGNNHYGCHVAACGLGGYWSNPWSEQYSVFTSCYSEGMMILVGYPSPKSSFGKGTVVIGGTHGNLISDEPYSELRGRYFRVNSAIVASGIGASGIFENSETGGLTLNGKGTISKTLTLTNIGSRTGGYGSAVEFRLPSGSTKPSATNSTTIEGGSLAVVWGGFEGTELKINLVPRKNLIAPITQVLVEGGTSVRRASLNPIIVDGVITGLEIMDAGAGYTTPPTITGRGLWAGLLAEAEIRKGEVVKVNVTHSPTDILTNTPKLALSVDTFSVRPDNSNNTKLGDVNNRWEALYTSKGLGLWGADAPNAKPVVSGSTGENEALKSLIAALASYGLVSDSTT